MAIGTIRIGPLSVSRLILGGNPFSGVSHRGGDKNLEMRHYYTAARIKESLRQAEELEINTFIGRADAHIVRLLLEYWDEGGTLQWIAQTCPEFDSERGIANAVNGGAKACYLHGGMMDFLVANKKLTELPAVIAAIRKAGIPAGIAGHNPKVFTWAEENLDVDFYMCSYYNAAHRDKQAELASGQPEWFKDEDRDVMVRVIKDLRKPVIHYKVMAAGRNDPQEALAFVACHLRSQDAVCVGVYTKDDPQMLAEDLQLLEKNLSK